MLHTYMSQPTRGHKRNGIISEEQVNESV